MELEKLCQSAYLEKGRLYGKIIAKAMFARDKYIFV